MSDIIHLLPDSVANQIAAGEVIQRPASVIKELVENAIDAEATEIHVLVTDAGKTCIQVIDDGKGMSETDARLSFERHATSKIREASDLFALRTMGFRGEALASVAAVAEVELKTRPAGEELGTRLVIAGSKVESQEAVSCPKGSNFSVKNLFFNIPARRKFLKANSTELSNILAEFERIALVHPDVAFYLYSNDAELFNLPVMPLRQRILAIFGKKLNQQLLSVDVDTTMIKVSGFVAKPEASRKKGAHQYFFVNGRYMRHPYFHKAVMDAYEQLIPAGEQISYFIYFEVDPANIDVNIHPTKTEIKFENEQAIWQILSAAVKESLGKFNAVPSIDFDTEGMPDIPAFEQSRPIEPPKVHYNADFNPFKTSSPTARSLTELINCFTTLKFTSASNSARFTSFIASFTSASVIVPLLLNFRNTFCNLSVKLSNAMRLLPNKTKHRTVKNHPAARSDSCQYPQTLHPASDFHCVPAMPESQSVSWLPSLWHSQIFLLISVFSQSPPASCHSASSYQTRLVWRFHIPLPVPNRTGHSSQHLRIYFSVSASTAIHKNHRAMTDVQTSPTESPVKYFSFTNLLHHTCFFSACQVFFLNIYNFLFT